MKLLYNVIASLFLPLSLFAQSSSKITDKISNILSDPYFDTTTIAIDVFDLTASKSIFSYNENLLLRPASNLKLFTSAAGLFFLGPEYKFTTSLYHTGEISDSVCHGDLYIAGGFDPEFTDSDIDSMINSILEFGIKEIQGNIYGDVSIMDSLYWGKGWMWDDDPFLYSPYLTPLSINKNGLKISYEPGEIGFPAKVSIIPQSDFCNIYNTSVTIPDDTSDFTVTRDYLSHSNDIIIGGTLSFTEKADTTELNILHPEQYFISLFKGAIIQRGISFIGITDTATTPGHAVLITSIDRPLKDVIENLNKESDNLNAELLLRALAYQCSGKPASADKGINLIDSLITLMGIKGNNFRIVDGSGLSFYNLVSVRSINELLKHLYLEKNELFDILYNSLSVAGIDGKLKNRMKHKPTYNNVHAKTGSLSGVSALSGYLTTANEHLISFSIIIQNFIGNSRLAKYFQDEICKILCGIEDEEL